MGSNEFSQAKTRIEEALKSFNSAIGSLCLRVGTELLLHTPNPKKKQILDWIWPGDYSQKQRTLRSTRIPNVGNQVPESEIFHSWANKGECGVLICHGLRK